MNNNEKISITDEGTFLSQIRKNGKYLTHAAAVVAALAVADTAEARGFGGGNNNGGGNRSFQGGGMPQSGGNRNQMPSGSGTFGPITPGNPFTGCGCGNTQHHGPDISNFREPRGGYRQRGGYSRGGGYVGGYNRGPSSFFEFNYAPQYPQYAEPYPYSYNAPSYGDYGYDRAPQTPQYQPATPEIKNYNYNYNYNVAPGSPVQVAPVQPTVEAPRVEPFVKKTCEVGGFTEVTSDRLQVIDHLGAAPYGKGKNAQEIVLDALSDAKIELAAKLFIENGDMGADGESDFVEAMKKARTDFGAGTPKLETVKEATALGMTYMHADSVGKDGKKIDGKPGYVGKGKNGIQLKFKDGEEAIVVTVDSVNEKGEQVLSQYDVFLKCGNITKMLETISKEVPCPDPSAK